MWARLIRALGLLAASRSCETASVNKQIALDRAGAYISLLLPSLDCVELVWVAFEA